MTEDYEKYMEAERNPWGADADPETYTFIVNCGYMDETEVVAHYFTFNLTDDGGNFVRFFDDGGLVTGVFFNANNVIQKN